MQQPPASTLRQVCPLAPLPPGVLNRLLRGSIAGPLAGFGMRRGFIRGIPDPSRGHGNSGPSRGRSRGSGSVAGSFAGIRVRRGVVRGVRYPSRAVPGSLQCGAISSSVPRSRLKIVPGPSHDLPGAFTRSRIHFEIAPRTPACCSVTSPDLYRGSLNVAGCQVAEYIQTYPITFRIN